MIRPLYNPTLRGCCESCSHSSGMGFMGDAGPITSAQAFQQALSMYAGENINPRDSGNQAWISANESQIEAGQFLPYPGCTGQAPNLNLFQTASGLALGTTSAAVGFLGPSGAAVISAAAVPVIGWAVAGVSAIIGLISAIFQHHAAAVKRDLNFSCSTLPAVNNAFSLIAQAVQNGTMTASDAASALPEIYSEFMSAGGASGSISGPGSIPGGGTPINDSPYCNSNCELSICLLGMVLYWQGQYEAMAAQQEASQAAAQQSAASPATSILPTIDPATGLVTAPAASPAAAATIDPVTGAIVAAGPAPRSWFTENSIFPGVPNWALLVGGFVGLKMARVL